MGGNAFGSITKPKNHSAGVLPSEISQFSNDGLWCFVPFAVPVIQCSILLLSGLTPQI